MKAKNTKSKKDRTILDLKIYEWVLIVVVIFLLIFILATKDKNSLKNHCQKAICNEDYTICSNYEVKDGKTIKTWTGSCKSLK